MIVIAISASARKDGNTKILLEQVLEEMAAIKALNRDEKHAWY